MLSSKAVRVGIYSALSADRGIASLVGRRIYHAEAPSDANFPLVVFHKQGGTSTDTFGDRAWLRQPWLVKCVDRSTSSSAAEDARATAIDVLSGGSVAVPGGTVFDLRYTSDVDYLETVNGVQYRHHGALFQITVV